MSPKRRVDWTGLRDRTYKTTGGLARVRQDVIMKSKRKIWFGVGAFVVAGTAASGVIGPLAEAAPSGIRADAWPGSLRSGAGRHSARAAREHAKPDAGEAGEAGESSGIAKLPPELAFATRIALVARPSAGRGRTGEAAAVERGAAALPSSDRGTLQRPQGLACRVQGGAVRRRAQGTGRRRQGPQGRQRLRPGAEAGQRLRSRTPIARCRTAPATGRDW